MARVSIVLNNGTVATAANTAVTPTVIYLGNTNNGASGLFTGHIRAIAAYSTLSDADLATLSVVDTPLSIPATGGAASGAASSAGTNTSTVVGQWLQAGVASSAGANTSSVTATWKQDGVASSAGSNTATVIAKWLQNGVSSSAGANTASVTATWIQAGIAASAGTNTGSGTATWGQAGVASSAGTNTSSASASPIQAAVASSAGTNTSAAIGAWLQSGVASSAGDNASAVTAQWGQAGVASSTGSNLSNAYFAALPGVASSGGANTASVVGQWLQAGVASSAGANTASATGRWSQAGVASSAGSNTALVISLPTGTTGVASSSGANTASAVGRWLQAGIASSAGTNTGSVASPAAMPSGAVGIWYVDQYSASPSGIQNAIGSTALTSAGTADGNLYLAGGTTPSGGVLDFNSGEIGTVVFPSSVSLPAATVIYSCSKVAESTGVHVIVADRASYHFWSAGEDISGFGPGFQIFSAEYSGQGTGSLWDKVGNGWHVSSLSYDAGSSECWIDGIKVLSRSVTPPTHSLTSLDIGQVAGTINAGYRVNAIAFYNRKLLASEQASAYAALKARAALSSLTIPSTSPERILFAMGDSITDGSFGDIGIGATNPGYVYAAARSATPVIRGGNLGVGGRTIATTDPVFDSTYGPMISAAVAAGGGRDIICTMALGTNDLLSYSGVSAWLTAFANLCDKVRATGAKLIVATIIPNVNPSFNTARAIANAAIRTWVGTHADAIMDFASDSIMGLDATASNGTYFADGTHPRGAGHARMAPYLVSALDYLSSAPTTGTTGVAFSTGTNISGVVGSWIKAGVATSVGGNTSSVITSVAGLDFNHDFAGDFQGGLDVGTTRDFGDDFSGDFLGGLKAVINLDFNHDFAGDFSGGLSTVISGDFNHDFTADFSGGLFSADRARDFSQDFSSDFAVFVGVNIVSGTATSAGSNIASVKGDFSYVQLSDTGVASSTGSNISSMVGSWEAIPVPPYVPAPEPVVKQWVPASEFQRVQQPRADRVYRTVPELRRVQPSRATRIIQTGPSARRINLPNMKRRYG
jgi:lysophospholipase L1-like esterase